jgi:hypothetical protein
MDTRRSTDWRATAILYSGRPDPEWEVGPELARPLAELPPLEGEPPSAPPLGYRGVALISPGGARYEAYGGAVAFDHRERRADPGRRFERSVLESAPPGLLPDGLV